jgi:hypothetical protein
MNQLSQQDGWIGQVRQDLGAVRQLLRSPSLETWVRCCGRLEHAIGCLKNVEELLRAAPPSGAQHSRRELELVRRELDEVAAMVQGAASFYEGLGQILASATAGYTITGKCGAWRPAARLAVEG